MSMDRVANVHRVLPVDQDRMVALSIDDGVLAAYDAEAQKKLFEGRYFAPRAYRGRDPRRWTARMFQQLKWEYGLYGGTRLHGTIFVIAEGALLGALMHASTPEELRRIERMPLVDALAAVRDAWSEAMREIEQRDVA